jgi:CRISPR system Cascade subunit CasE
MYFSRITLKDGVDKEPEFWRLGSQYSIHQAVWDIFSGDPNKKRDFLYRIENIGRFPLIYAVSCRKPIDSAIWNFETKEYNPQIPHGTHLGFVLRVNPIITREKKRHDVVMDYKRRLKDRSEAVENREVVQEAGRKWLESKGEKNGFKIEQVKADGYLQHKFVKKISQDVIQYSTLDFTGIIAVINEGLFKNLLFHGIGAEKGFGCGLMLVRKI